MPNIDMQYTLIVDSDVFTSNSGGKYMADLTFFYPVITFLDSTKHIIRTTGKQELRKLNDRTGAAYLRLSTDIQPDDGARFFILHTSKDFLENGAMYDACDPGVTVPVAKAFVHIDGSCTVLKFFGSPEGKMKLTLIPKAPS